MVRFFVFGFDNSVSDQFYFFLRHGGRSELCLCSNGVKATEYVKVLETNLLPIFKNRRLKVTKKNFLFQEDGAPCHTAKTTQEWIKKAGINKLQWVAQSPDMNPIEHVWWQMKRRLHQTRLRPSTREALFELIKKIWAELPQRMIDRLIESVPRRFEALKKARGGSTRY